MNRDKNSYGGELKMNTQTTSQPKQCGHFGCIYSQCQAQEYEFEGEKINADVWQCLHPSANETDEPLVEQCPVVQVILRHKGFMKKCILCGEIEVDYHSKGIDVWCNQDRLLECILEEMDADSVKQVIENHNHQA